MTSDAPAGFEILPPERDGPPVVVHAPHGGTTIPAAVRADLLPDDDGLATELLRMTDHRTDALAQHLVERVGATAFVNRLSRLVVDPESFLDPDEEAMEEVGMGVVYTQTHDLQPLREQDPDGRDRLIRTFFEPYAAALADLVTGMLERKGTCLIVDLHSYPSRRLPYEQGDEQRPAVCVGTDDFHTPSAVVGAIRQAAREHRLDVGLDSPFPGTYVPLRHLGRDRRVTSVMLELRRDTHIDETTGRPNAGYARIERFLGDAVTAATEALEPFRP